MRMSNFLLALLLGGLLFLPPGMSVARQRAATVELGVLPYLNPRAIVTLYQPLRAYLEKRLKQPVVIVTAPNFKTYIERTRQRQYPVLMTAPHMGRLAQLEAGYVPMLIGNRKLYGVLVAAKSGTIRHIRDLRGKTIAMPDRLAIMSMLGETLLRTHGLTPGRDVTLRPFLSHTSAALSVLRGENAAAVIAELVFRQLPESTRSRLKVLAETNRVPHLLYMASPDLPSGEIAQLRQIMRDFVSKTPEGKHFMKKLNLDGWHPPTQKELAGLDPYAREVRALMNGKSQGASPSASGQAAKHGLAKPEKRH